MDIKIDSFRKTEQLTYILRKLFEQYGFERYSMNHMEEFSFYMENLNFLQNKEVITFTDLDGRLMALKPDITLSIVKNTNATPDCLTKLYYTENVFRPSKNGREFKEIRQMGLEAIGNVTDYTIIETLTLAAKSLAAISPNYILSITHLGLVSGLLKEMALDDFSEQKLLGCIQTKNEHDARRLMEKAEVPNSLIERLCAFIQLPADFEAVFSQLPAICAENAEMRKAVDQLSLIHETISDYPVCFESTLISDTNYYNGIVMQGYIKEIPEVVLSGGQYDHLLSRMDKSDLHAIGFALYFNVIEPWFRIEKTTINLTAVLYDSKTPLAEIKKAVEAVISADDQKVIACTKIPENITPEKVIDLRKGASNA